MTANLETPIVDDSEVSIDSSESCSEYQLDYEPILADEIKQYPIATRRAKIQPEHRNAIYKRSSTADNLQYNSCNANKMTSGPVRAYSSAHASVAATSIDCSLKHFSQDPSNNGAHATNNINSKDKYVPQGSFDTLLNVFHETQQLKKQPTEIRQLNADEESDTDPSMSVRGAESKEEWKDETITAHAAAQEEKSKDVTEPTLEKEVKDMTLYDAHVPQDKQPDAQDSDNTKEVRSALNLNLQTQSSPTVNMNQLANTRVMNVNEVTLVNPNSSKLDQHLSVHVHSPPKTNRSTYHDHDDLFDFSDDETDEGECTDDHSRRTPPMSNRECDSPSLIINSDHSFSTIDTCPTTADGALGILPRGNGNGNGNSGILPPSSDESKSSSKSGKRTQNRKIRATRVGTTTCVTNPLGVSTTSTSIFDRLMNTSNSRSPKKGTSKSNTVRTPDKSKSPKKPKKPSSRRSIAAAPAFVERLSKAETESSAGKKRTFLRRRSGVYAGSNGTNGSVEKKYVPKTKTPVKPPFVTNFRSRYKRDPKTTHENEEASSPSKISPLKSKTPRKSPTNLSPSVVTPETAYDHNVTLLCSAKKTPSKKSQSPGFTALDAESLGPSFHQALSDFRASGSKKAPTKQDKKTVSEALVSAMLARDVGEAISTDAVSVKPHPLHRNVWEVKKEASWRKGGVYHSAKVKGLVQFSTPRCTTKVAASTTVGESNEDMLTIWVKDYTYSKACYYG